MAGANIRFEWDDTEARAALDDLDARARDLRPAFEIIGSDLDLAHRERWDRQVSPDGTPWQPLSERVIRSLLLRSY